MVEVSVINAGKLRKALYDPTSAEGEVLNLWKGPNLYNRVGMADGNEIPSKWAGWEITIGDANIPVNYVSFLYRRKGLNYAERIHLRQGNMIKRTEQVASYWNRIVEWVYNGEIEESSDIIVYRSMRRIRRQSNLRSMDKYPIRLIDDTYAIYTGQTFWLSLISNAIRNGTIQTLHTLGALESIELRDNPPSERGDLEDFNNPERAEMYGNNRYCEAFEDWYEESVYQYDSKHFNIGDDKLRTRAYWIWVYLLTYGYDIRTIIDGIQPNLSYRGSLLLWKDGICKFWEETYHRIDSPPDRFAGLAVRDQRRTNAIPNNLIGTKYNWSDSDCLFIER